MPRGIPKSGVRKKKAHVRFFETSPEAEKAFQEFLEKEKGETVPPTVEIPVGGTKSPGTGDLPPTGETPKPEEKKTEEKKTEEPKQTQSQNPPFNAQESAKGLAVMVGMVGNFILWRQGRELINDMEISTYATEITPFVDKYQKYFQYMPEIRAVIGTAGFVWAISQKPVVDVEKYQAWKESKNGKG